jgi:NDP-sugar pyrophosphorylase family protein
MNNTTIVIVAGGLATRLQPITESIPKCMVDIKGKPLIEHQLDIFKAQGFINIHFCVAHLAEKVEEYFGDGKKLGLRITYSREKELVGTAGAVKLYEQHLTSTFIVYYGDIITNFPFEQFITFHKAKKGIATVALHERRPDSTNKNVIKMDNDRITFFLEKGIRDEHAADPTLTTLCNSGFYCMEPKALSYIPINTFFDFGKDVFPKLITVGEKVYGFKHQSRYAEIGTVEKYEKAK